MPQRVRRPSLGAHLRRSGPALAVLALLALPAACDDGSAGAPALDSALASTADAQAVRRDAGTAGSKLDAALAVPICGELGETPCSTDAGELEPEDSCGSGGPGCTEDPCLRTDAGVCTAEVSCDASKVLCKKAPPVCAPGQVPAVVDTCYGGCAQIDRCVCQEADQCPQREQYVCHMRAARCGPYVN
jgi:hypothetical protein